MSDYQKPVQRKGFTLTAVQWDRDGRLRAVKYERQGGALDAPAPPQPVAAPPPRRSIIAIEQGSLL